MRVKSQSARTLIAMASVLGLVLCAPVVETAAAAAHEVNIFSCVSGGAESVEAILGEGVLSGSQYVPDDFTNEAFSLEEAKEVEVELEQNLIGFCSDEEVGEVFDRVRSALEAAGWECTESGLEGCGTFTKETGELRWMFVDCTAASGQTSVVMEYAYNKK